MKRTLVYCLACLSLLLMLGCERPDSPAKPVDDTQETSTSQSSISEEESKYASETYVDKGVSSGIVSVKEFGAAGDGKADDTEAIQKAVSSGETIYFPAGNYVLSQPIVITGKHFWSLYAQDAWFVYDGDDYAFKINEAENCHIEIGEILAPNGGGIEFYSEDGQHWNQYVSLTFGYISCATDCIYVRVEGDGWCNENQVHGGRFAGGVNGVRIQKLGGDNPNGWKFYDCGIEGVNNGFHLDAGDGSISNVSVVNARYGESFDTILRTKGDVHDCLWVGTYAVTPDMVLCSENTTRFEVIAPIGWTGHRGCIVDGELMAERTEYERAE
jgi:hypothetical protein